MSERVLTWIAVGWRIALGGAVVALAGAAVATEAGLAVLSRFAGTTAWAAAVAGTIGGLITEFRKDPA